jgi:hypothetical protein
LSVTPGNAADRVVADTSHLIDERHNQKNLRGDKFSLLHGAENCSTAAGFTPGLIFGISETPLQSPEQRSKARGSKELRALILQFLQEKAMCKLLISSPLLLLSLPISVCKHKPSDVIVQEVLPITRRPQPTLYSSCVEG